ARPGLLAVGHLTRDTFRQAWSSGVGAIMLAVSAVCAGLCLSASVSGDVALQTSGEPSYFLPAASATDPATARREGVETVRGQLTLAFGAVGVPVGRDRVEAVRFVELLLAWGAAGTLGLLAALVGTAGFVPAFLEPRAASAL